jgi:hypothetical protein
MIHRKHIFRIKYHLVPTEIVEGLFEVVKQIPMLFRLHYYDINVIFDVPPNPRLQDDVNALLIRSFLILQPECHLGIIGNPKRCDGRCFFFIVNGEADLMIAEITVHTMMWNQ